MQTSFDTTDFIEQTAAPGDTLCETMREAVFFLNYGVEIYMHVINSSNFYICNYQRPCSLYVKNFMASDVPTGRIFR